MKAEQVKEWISEAAKASASEALRQNRQPNPNGEAAPPTAAPTRATRAKSDKSRIIARVDDAAAALADGDLDEGLDILNGVLDDYGDNDD